MLYNLHAEKSVLASVLYAPDDICKGLAAQLVSEVTIDHFSHNSCKAIFDIIEKITREGHAPTMINVVGSIPKDFENDVMALANQSTTSNIDRLLESIRISKTARAVVEVCKSVPARLEQTDDITLELKKIESEVLKAITGFQKVFTDEGTIGGYTKTYLEIKEEQLNTTEIIGIPTGMQKLDSLLGGLRSGETVVIGGRTSMGKSSLAFTWIAHQIMSGFKPAIFSFELSRVEMMDKLVAAISELDPATRLVEFKKIHNPAGNFNGARLSKKDFGVLRYVIERYMVDNDCFIRGTSKTTIEEVTAKIRKLRADGQCDLAYVDHLGLLVQDSIQERAELCHITGTLKLLAGDLKMPIVEVAQVNRGSEQTKQLEKPRLSHIKGSASIEEDANIVVMPWRPYAIHKDPDKNHPTESEIILAKSRNSETGSFPSYFSTLTTAFLECDPNAGEPDHEQGELF